MRRFRMDLPHCSTCKYWLKGVCHYYPQLVNRLDGPGCSKHSAINPARTPTRAGRNPKRYTHAQMLNIVAQHCQTQERAMNFAALDREFQRRHGGSVATSHRILSELVHQKSIVRVDGLYWMPPGEAVEV